MKRTINCFLPYTKEETTLQNIAALKATNSVNKIFLLAQKGAEPKCAPKGCKVIGIDTLTSSQTMTHIAKNAKSEYTLLYMSTSPLKLEDGALDKMIEPLKKGDATMVYADRYELKEGQKMEHPVADYQKGSVRDDFDFGPLMMFESTIFLTSMMPVAALEKKFRYAGFYLFRLFHADACTPCHIKEYLYTVDEQDARQSGEKQFDYVNPRNREVQIEMEEVFTFFLQDSRAWLPSHSIEVDLKEGDFPCEASVIIPVKNRVRTIDDAIHSVLEQQTDFPFNVIIVDNHSTDGTTEAIARYADHPQVIHLQPERTDLGIGGCWDYAIRQPQCGRFAVQLDSDDLYSSPNTLQTIVNKFYEEQCAMVIGSYRMTDFQLNTLPPGLIDHKEWTDENGRNNALRVNGLGAPRAFFTPVLREIGVPNVSYGEDYALGLAFSRSYRIGRIYDELYLCRRWEGNSDANLSIEKVNANNAYKDSLRTQEIEIRKELAMAMGDKERNKAFFDFLHEQLETWELAADNHKALQSSVQTKEEEIDGTSFRVQFNPSRMVSTGAKLDKESIQQRPCFLCAENRPAEQGIFECVEAYDLCVNPYPILPNHVTIISKEHREQVANMPDFYFDYNDILFDYLPESFVLFYNGAHSGASAPDHFHFQAAPKEYVPLMKQYEELKKDAMLLGSETDTFTKDIFGGSDEEVSCQAFYLDNYVCPLFCIEGGRLSPASGMLDKLCKLLPTVEGEAEPRMNIFAWKEGNTIITLVIPRSKHRPDCYSAEGEAQMIVSPGALDMAGILVTPREEDFRKTTADDIRSIIREVGLDREEARRIANEIKNLKN